MPQSKWHYADVSCAYSGGRTVQSEHGEMRASVPTLASLDEEFGGADLQVAPELEYQPLRRRRRYVWFLLPSAVLAVLSFVIWPNGALQLWSFAQLLPNSLAAQPAPGSGAVEPIADLDALKNEIAELRYGQQRMSAEIAALQIAQQELQDSSNKTVSWYSEPNALLYHQIATAPKPRTVALRSKNTEPRGATREVNAQPENSKGPLPLVGSQSATGATPIR